MLEKKVDESLSVSLSDLSNFRFFVCLLKTSLEGFRIALLSSKHLSLKLFKDFFVPDAFLSTFPFE